MISWRKRQLPYLCLGFCILMAFFRLNDPPRKGEIKNETFLQESETLKWGTMDAQSLIEKDYIAEIHMFPASAEKRVISFGLYGESPKYTVGAIRNAERVPIFFPGWTARFYIDQRVPKDVVTALEARKAEIVRIDDNDPGNTILGMFWRFLVADDTTVDRFIVRDTDSRLNARDRFAVEEWILSNKSVHLMRDHWYHDFPIMGGMWGAKRGAILDMTGKIRSWGSKATYGQDMDFLNAVIWPEIQNDQISHDSYHCQKYPNVHPFPTRRSSTLQHVGQIFDEDDNIDPSHIEVLRIQQVPEECRKHPNWVHG